MHGDTHNNLTKQKFRDYDMKLIRMIKNAIDSHLYDIYLENSL